MTTEEKPRYWIGFDLGGTKMQCTLFDEKLKVVDSQRKRTRSEQATGENVERIRNTIAKLLDEHKIPLENLSGIGIGCPGPVEWEKGDWRHGIVRVAVNLGWENVPIAKLLKEQFKCPVAVLNDVDAGVYGEFHSGAAQGSRSRVLELAVAAFTTAKSCEANCSVVWSWATSRSAVLRGSVPPA